jgi:hypothetical protein
VQAPELHKRERNRPGAGLRDAGKSLGAVFDEL